MSRHESRRRRYDDEDDDPEYEPYSPEPRRAREPVNLPAMEPTERAADPAPAPRRATPKPATPHPKATPRATPRSARATPDRYAPEHEYAPEYAADDAVDDAVNAVDDAVDDAVDAINGAVDDAVNDAPDQRDDEYDAPRRRRGSRSPKKSSHRVSLGAGDVRSDPALDISLRDLTRAHWNNEPAVVAMVQHITSEGVLLAPDGASQASCDAAFRLLQLHDSSEGRAAAREVLSDLADADGDPVEAVTLLLHFTKALDAQTRAAIAHALLLAPSASGPGRLLAKIQEVNAVRACGGILFATAVHMAYGLAVLIPEEWPADASAMADNMQATLDWVVVQAERLDAGYDDCPLVEYDLGVVEALAQMVCDLPDPDNLCRHLFAYWLELTALDFENTIERSRQRRSYRQRCDHIHQLCAGQPVRWQSLEV